MSLAALLELFLPLPSLAEMVGSNLSALLTCDLNWDLNDTWLATSGTREVSEKSNTTPYRCVSVTMNLTIGNLSQGLPEAAGLCPLVSGLMASAN